MPYDIAIVGCGIAGTSAALMLARTGHRVTLFEQTDHVGPVGAGVLLQPSGQRVLAEMGLLDQLLPNVERIDSIRAVTERGKQLVHLHYAERSAQLFGAGVHRGDLFSLLHSHLNAAGVKLLLGTRIVAAEGVERQPTLTDAHGQSYGPFDLLVIADGSRSVLRDACGLPGHVLEYDYGALWAVCDIAPVRGQLFQTARGTTELGGLLPIGNGRCSLFWGLRRDRFRDLTARGYAAWQSDVLRLMPHAQPLVDRIGSFDAMRFVAYRHVWTRRLWRGRAVLIGDAGHAMSPHLGQGVNLALQDARSLATAIDTEPTIAGAFEHYVRSRRNAVRYYGAVTAFLSPFFQSDTPVLGLARNVALPLLCKFAPTRRAMLRTLCGV